jgi:ABC-2 type transport system permease protein
MRKTLRFIKREYLAAVKTKGFIIMLVLMPILMGGSGIAMYLLQGQVDTKDKRVIIVDRAGIVTDMILKAAEKRNAEAVFDKETGKKVRPAYMFEAAEPNISDPQTQRLELSEHIRKGELHAFLEVGPNVLHPKGDESTFEINYHAKNAAIDSVRSWLDNTINPYLRRIRLSEEGIEGPKADEIMTWIRVEPMGLVSVDEATGAIKEARRTGELETILVPIVLFFLMFMLVMMGAMPLLQSTMEEKTQRIAEVLLGSLKPHQFMTGKVVGGLLVSLTGALVYVAGGVFFMGRMGLTHFIPFHVIPWFFAFLILEIVMVGSILSAFGSACNDPKDAQNLTFPAMFPVFLPMFIFMPVLQEPTSAFATWLSLFPLFTPMLMIIRTASPVGIPAWQPWVGLAEVILFTVFIVWIGGRIFRVGILMQGGPPKISKMIKWAFKG